jgi:hypothetical protein
MKRLPTITILAYAFAEYFELEIAAVQYWGDIDKRCQLLNEHTIMSVDWIKKTWNPTDLRYSGVGSY